LAIAPFTVVDPHTITLTTTNQDAATVDVAVTTPIDTVISSGAYTFDFNPTTTSVGSSLSPTAFTENVTFTATVNNAGATGSVTFMDGVDTLGSSMLSAGIATFETTSLSVGDHSISAVYAGDGEFSGSTSNTITQTIVKADQTVGFTSTATNAVFGASYV